MGEAWMHVRGRRCMYGVRFLLSGVAGLGLVASGMALMVTFPVGTGVDYNAGTYTVIRNGYKFQKAYYLAINPYSDSVRHVGGLWVHPSYGVGVHVSRVDGAAFSLNNFTILERPGITGTPQYDPFTLTAYNPGNPYAFGGMFYSDYSNQTYDTFSPVAQNSRFGNVSQVWIENDYPFILDSLDLQAVPEPATVGVMGLGLAVLARCRMHRKS